MKVQKHRRLPPVTSSFSKVYSLRVHYTTHTAFFIKMCFLVLTLPVPNYWFHYLRYINNNCGQTKLLKYAIQRLIGLIKTQMSTLNNYFQTRNKGRNPNWTGTVLLSRTRTRPGSVEGCSDTGTTYRADTTLMYFYSLKVTVNPSRTRRRTESWG